MPESITRKAYSLSALLCSALYKAITMTATQHNITTLHAFILCVHTPHERKKNTKTYDTTTEHHHQTRLQKGNLLLALHSFHMQNTLQWRPVGENRELLTSQLPHAPQL